MGAKGTPPSAAMLSLTQLTSWVPPMQGSLTPALNP